MRIARKAARLLAPLLLLVVPPAVAAFRSVDLGQEAPDFNLTALAGEKVHLKQKIGPKALALVFWAAWSPRSKPMLDDLEKIYRDRKDKGLQILAINVEHEEIGPEDRKAIAEMAANWSFPILLDEGLSTYYAYGVVATPSLAVIDESGVIRYARASYSSSAREDIKEALDGLLGLAEGKAGPLAAKPRSYVPPKKATLHYQKAQALLQRGMGRKAAQDLEEAAKIDPAWAEPRVMLARIYWQESLKHPEMLEKAEATLREAQAIQPKHLQTVSLLSEVLLRRGKNEEALAVAQQGLDLESGFTPALVAKARSLRALGRVDEAQKALNEAMELDPRNPYVFLEKGELAALRGKWEEAANSLRQALDLALAIKEEG